MSEEAEGSRRLSRAISTTERLIPAAQARLERGRGDRPESQDTQKNKKNIENKTSRTEEVESTSG